MRKTFYLLALSAALSTFAFAESFTGNLLDATCYQSTNKAESCAASGTTRAFALEVSGKVLKLDESGNQKAAAAVKNRADRAAEPGKPQSTKIMAKVEGTEAGGTITTQAIDIQ
ncbi:MAG TPA: hypothetical protein VHY84_15165 [Bryobacteraceae bacterium]|jgi:hypothetical protein|nr:hypothetical protein [Bryobacteraceae bacterium]